MTPSTTSNFDRWQCLLLKAIDRLTQINARTGSHPVTKITVSGLYRINLHDKTRIVVTMLEMIASASPRGCGFSGISLGAVNLYQAALLPEIGITSAPFTAASISSAYHCISFIRSM